MTTSFIEDTKLIQHEIHDEMKNSYIDYAMSVIVSRALPDARDGLKPVHRRILYGMSELGVTPDKPHKKSARIVGEVMGKYHPHGDSSIYDAMVRMAQDFSINYPLVDGHGNFGSVDGDGAAAMRYTEARMTPFALQMLRDIEKNTVDFMPNFDEEEQEPVVLPARYPNLLVNGSNGIAVGMATSIPPHNLKDVIDATVKLIDDQDAKLEDLIKIVKAPDFPTGAIIMGKNSAKDAYRTGQGKVTVRAKAEIEETGKGRQQIVFTEIPYQVNKARVIEKIAELVREKRLDQISDIRDESDRSGMRIVIELKRDANPQITLNRLYKHTQLQDNYSMIMLALVDGKPITMNLKQMLEVYLNHQKEVVTRRTIYDLKKAEDRAHILEGLRIALDHIDEVIKTIRESYNDAKPRLIERFGLSEIQAQAILDMRLARLQGLEREKIENEYKELMEQIAWFKKVLADESILLSIIKEELLEIKKKFGVRRKTEIKADAEDIDEEDMIQEEKVAVTLTYLGYIKRVSADTYKTQRRGGKGVMGVTTRENDFVKDLIMTSTHDYLMFFTNTGKAHKIKAYEIPEAQRTAKGTPAVNFLSLMQRERINAVIPIQDFGGDKYLIGVTKQGIIKKTDLSQFDTNRKTGLIAIKLKEKDELIGIKQTTGTSNVIIVTKHGKCICFSEEDVRSMGRLAGGVRAIKLDKGDEVVAMELAEKYEELLVVTQNGYGKRTAVEEYKIQARGGKGLLTYDKAKFKKTGALIGAMIVNENDEILLINSDGIIIRIKAGEVSRLGRATQGVKIMRVDENANIITMAKVIKNEDEDEIEENSVGGEKEEKADTEQTTQMTLDTE
ncbi:MAG: DNA gyrase subunit A [Eubacteriales bacterium]|nr:DNA gyrase subunit A [Eubacteriales bacterium]MDD3200002.1 DNA gyrase subunit A [Eubacteriales bacterium]MDD4121272.1 DNA gyrase subunit A [Eubacteriales bacterium]MDD4629975.1 DNA gyrase subunit A [Eubacteriales bacterium]